MIRTRITDILGIRVPVMQGGLQWLARAELASAVSNGGGLGTINALSFASPDELKDEIRKMKDLTDKPFAVNVSMLPVIMEGEIYEKYFDVIIEEGVKIVETSGRNPEPYLPRLKEAGIKIIHKVPAIRYARKAESIGVDIVTIVGFECGGHPGMDDVTTLILAQKARKTLKIPYFVGGGFCDGRGLVAALALGADGIVMGTRFMATKECPAHENFKRWMIQAEETDTIIIERSIKNPARVRKNKSAYEVLKLEEKGATLDELMPIIAGKVGLEAYISGDLDKGVIACGEVVGLIDDIPSAKELVERIEREAEEIIENLSTFKH